jgi:hypothetical protein
MADVYVNQDNQVRAAVVEVHDAGSGKLACGHVVAMLAGNAEQLTAFREMVAESPGFLMSQCPICTEQVAAARETAAALRASGMTIGVRRCTICGANQVGGSQAAPDYCDACIAQLRGIWTSKGLACPLGGCPHRTAGTRFEGYCSPRHQMLGRLAAAKAELASGGPTVP